MVTTNQDSPAGQARTLESTASGRQKVQRNATDSEVNFGGKHTHTHPEVYASESSTALLNNRDTCAGKRVAR